MCYSVFISTTSAEDFSLLPTSLYRFEIPDNDSDAEPLGVLKHPHKWYLASRYGGCSCHYRHESADNTSETGPSQTFGPPEDWCPEDAEYVESTAAVYDVFQRVIAEGNQLDALDIWNGADVGIVRAINVSLARTPRESFRFFENHRFELFS